MKLRLIRNILLLAAAVTLPPAATLSAQQGCTWRETGTGYWWGCTYYYYEATMCNCPEGSGYIDYRAWFDTCANAWFFETGGCYYVAK
jgi:hypothetical protein